MNHIRSFSPLRLVGQVIASAALALLPLSGMGQVVFSATAIQSGTWQTPANWTITPGGSASAFPNNSAGEVFDVALNTSRSFDLSADVRIRNLTSGTGLNFQNAAGRTFTVNGALTAGGSLTAQSSINFVTRGASQINARFDLRNGSTFENYGTLTVGPLASVDHFADTSVRAGGYTMMNAGSVLFDRPGGVVFQNYNILNTGLWDIRQGTVQADSFTQTDANAVFRVRAGATVTANALNFNGGSVIASGSTLNGSSFSFKNSTLYIGESLTDISTLSLTGNATSDAGQGATFRFLVAGAAAGQYDTLAIQSGMNFSGLTLKLSTLGYTIKNSDSFTIITGNNLLNGTFANQIGGKLNVAGLGEFDITRTQASVVLSNFTPVPEPEELALAVGLGLLGFGIWRKRITTAVA